MSYHCERCGGEVDLARTPLESGLVRLAVLGPEGFALTFDDPAVHAAAAPALGPCPHELEPSWDRAALQPLADAGWQALLGNRAGAGPAGADEKANFAIWYTYYRTRIAMVKSSASESAPGNASGPAW